MPYPEDKLFGWLFAAVLLVPLVFSLVTYESFEIFKYTLVLVFTGAGLLAVALKTKAPGRQLRANKFFYWCLGLFWLWALLSSLLAWDKNYSFFGFYARFTNGFLFYSAWAILLLLLNLLDWGQVYFLLKTLVLTSGLVALWGILQSIGIGFYLGLTTDYFNRAAPSFLGNTDFSSMFVVALLPITVLLFLRSRNFWGKTYYALSAFVQLVSLFIFASRGALLALVVAMLVAVFLIIRFGKGKILVWLAVLVVLVALGGGLGAKFLNFSRPQTLQSISLSDVNTTNRLAVWKLSLSSIIRRPVFGVGLGNFQLMFEHDRTAPLITSGFFDDAHNLPLELAVTGGVFFLLWFLALIGWGAYKAYGRLGAGSQPEDIALLTALAAWLTASLFTPVAIPCYVLLAVLISACFRENFRRLNLQPAMKWAVATFGAGFVVWGIVFFSAEILFFRGVQSYNGGKYRLAYELTSLATRLNPTNRLYFVYESGSAIRSDQPLGKVEELLARTQKINSTRAYSFTEQANLDYLLLYQTKNFGYMNLVLDNLKTAIKLDPYFSGNYFTLSAYDVAFAKLADAESAVKTGLILEPNNLGGEIFLAKIYQLQNNKAGLLDALTKAYKADPSNLVVLKIWHEMQQSDNVAAVPFDINLGLGHLD